MAGTEKRKRKKCLPKPRYYRHYNRQAKRSRNEGSRNERSGQ